MRCQVVRFTMGVIVLCCSRVASAEIEYNDGQTHIVNTVVSQSVEVEGKGTTLNLVSGGVMEVGSFPFKL